MNNIKAYERAFQNAGDKEPIVNPEDETQAWAPLNNEGNSWVSVVFVEKTRGDYLGYELGRE